MNNYNNLNEKYKDDIIVLDVKDIIKIFNKGKWWFIGVFIIVLIISLLLTFNLDKNSQYGVKSQLSVNSNNIDYQNIISTSYPEDSDKLWMVSTAKWWIIGTYLDRISNEIKSDEIINDLNKLLGLNISNNELKKQIRVDIVTTTESNIVLTTYANNLDNAKKINESLIKIYINKKANEFNNAYNELLKKVDSKLSIDQQELQKLSKEAEDYVNNENKKLLEDLLKSKNTTEVINFTSSNFIPPELQNKINVITADYNSLTSIKKNLTDYKEMYINRIVVQNLSDIEENSFILRNIIISFFASLFAGIITVYGVNFINKVRGK
jgi:uncharacterized protein involved in exopolysaccharide biosynthesis